jgi:hypothetical protein
MLVIAPQTKRIEIGKPGKNPDKKAPASKAKRF